MKIIGLAGTFSSGKDTLAEVLVTSFGYVHISTSDIVRELSQEKYQSTDRSYLQVVSNEYREKFGNDYFVAEAFKRYKNMNYNGDNPGVVISGVRSVGEAEGIKKLGGILVFVDAPIEVRYERAKLRARDDEVRSFESFKDSEAKEWDAGASNKTLQNLKGVYEVSDIKLDNSNNLESFIGEAVTALDL